MTTPDSSRDWPTLLANNARTGGQSPRQLRSPEKAAWQFRTGSAVRSAPVLDDGALYVASVNGTLHVLDVATGMPKWKLQAFLI
jgi:outer membrane protein assembly factor BamB